MAFKHKVIAGVVALVVGCGAAIAQKASKPKPELTELQMAKGELVKLQIQLASRDSQIAQCKIQLLQAPAKQLEQEFLKQVGASSTETWDWASMSPKKP